MPVTAKLSREFYERFGDDIANEIVDWFNAVDSTYQAQIREINDLNWQRIDARFSAFDARFTAFESVFDARFRALEEKFEARFTAFETVVDAMFRALEEKFDARLGALESRMDEKRETSIQRLRSELILWMFGFWTATVVPLVGVMLALSGAFRQ